VLISVMKKHQRYFPVSAGEKLLPYFIVIRNGDSHHLEVVKDGNEQVIRARFADAAFFVNEDLKHPLPSYLPRLGTLTFQKKLGSMLDKSQRVTRLAEALTLTLGLDETEARATRRAAELCKADLVTRMVVEMTSLQGIMGRYYALHSGEEEAVARAIFEHYLPRFTGDAGPKSRPGLVVGLADRLDSLAGLFAAGLAPSSTRDPFAQRRAALGLVQNLMAWDLDFNLQAGLAQAAAFQPIPASAESQAACLDFITGRMRSLLVESYRYDVVDAVLAAQRPNPASAVRAVKALSAWVSRSDWSTILPAYARCVRITRDQPRRYLVENASLVEPAETRLLGALEEAEAALAEAAMAEGIMRRAGSVEDFFRAFLPLIPEINQFFVEVLVMAEDATLRSNRLGLLQRIAALADGVADFSLLEGF
jgi:glycyl-tRNA synthetase